VDHTEWTLSGRARHRAHSEYSGSFIEDLRILLAHAVAQRKVWWM